MAQKNVSRRDFLRVSALTAAGAALAGCAPQVVKETVEVEVTREVEVEKEVEKVVEVEVEKEVEKIVEVTAEPTEAPPLREPVALQWWTGGWGGTAPRAGQLAIEGAFNAKGTGITVEWVDTPEMNDKLMTAIAGATAPDIGICCVEYASYYARDAFMPLDDYISVSQVIKKDEFVPGLFESMTYQGKTLGVPALECGPRYGQLFNKGLVEEAGLDISNLPQTWDEMYEWHEALTQFDAAGNVEVVGFDSRDGTGGNGPATNVTMFWAVSAGVEVWDGNTMTFNFDNEEMVAALEALKRFYDYVGVEQMAAFRGSFGGWTQSPSSSFPGGVQGALITGYYAPGELAHSGPDIELAASWPIVPEDRRGTKLQMVGGHPAYIPVGAPNPDAAFEFIEFLTTDAVAEIMFATTGWLPGRQAFYDPSRPDFDVYPGLRWYIESVQEANEFWAGPIIPIQGFMNQQRVLMYDAVVYGEKTPAEAVADMQQTCTEELAREFPELVG